MVDKINSTDRIALGADGDDVGRGLISHVLHEIVVHFDRKAVGAPFGKFQLGLVGGNDDTLRCLRNIQATL